MEDVEASAREWLALADAGDWDASYNLASSKFQAGIAASSWAAAAAGRGEYGDVVNREAMRIDIVQSSGTDYHVVRFRTDFENLRSAFERVTLEYEGGVFKVSGYWIEEQPVADSAPASAARNWLTLVDSQDWEASYAAAGKVFQEPNTVASWQRASELARSPLGAVMAREVVQVEEIASPEAYVLVRFKTDFENRQGVIESVTLQRENGVLKVVGYFIT